MRSPFSKPAQLFSFLFLCIIVSGGIANGDASALQRNAQWAVRGIGAELFTNAVIRPLSVAFGGRTQRHQNISDSDRARPGEIAIVTGATGGIGAEICRGLVGRGFHVLVLARNPSRGRDLADSLAPHATFVEYHADKLDSAHNVQRIMHDRALAVLINNAGTMGGSKSDTMKVNLLGPSALTLSLMHSMEIQSKQEGAPSPLVVNVGSSSHLRAAEVRPNTMNSDEIDSNLAAYAESKLGLMQFSNILRRTFPWLLSIDAHPGLVWTPLLKNHFPGAKMMERVGVSNLLYKTPEGGASTILAAVDTARASYANGGQNDVSKEQNWSTKQVYFVNMKPGGYASKESRNDTASWEMWRNILGPALKGLESNTHSYLEVQDRHSLVCSSGVLPAGKETNKPRVITSP